MGLIKKDGYNVKGVELPEAYAKITKIYMDRGNLARTYFGISSNRENINNNDWLVELEFPCYVDKNLPIYEQVYVLAKDNLFRGWEDDIVEEVPVEEEHNEEEIAEEETPVDTMPMEENIEVSTNEIIEEPTEPERGSW